MKKFAAWLLVVSLLILSHGLVAYHSLQFAYAKGHEDGAKVIIDSLFQSCLSRDVLFVTPFGTYRCTYGTDS